MQFLTKFQKLDGFRGLSPVRVCSRVSAYAYPDIFCTSLESAHQYGARRAGERPFRPARAAGAGRGAGGATRASPGAVLRAIRAESGDREQRLYTCISQQSGRSGTSYCPPRQKCSPSGHSRRKRCNRPLCLAHRRPAAPMAFRSTAISSDGEAAPFQSTAFGPQCIRMSHRVA